MNKQKGSVLVIILSSIIAISLIAIGVIMFLSNNPNKNNNLTVINNNQSQPPTVENPISNPVEQPAVKNSSVDKDNSSISNNFYNCNFSGSFGKDGGLFSCQNGGGIKIELNSSKFPDFKTSIGISVPKEAEIYKTLDPNVPYVGAIKIEMGTPSQNPPKNLSSDDMKFTINIPLKSKLPPGTGLEPFLRGTMAGQWIRQTDIKSPQDTYAKAIVNQDGLTASFIPKSTPSGLFIVRMPDNFSVPTINYDATN